MNIKIQEICDDHYSDLISLFQEFAHFEKLSEKMINSVEQMKIEKEYINGFVAISERNEVVGYVTFCFVYYTWIGKSMYMDDLYVRKEYRGSGIGTKLIKNVIDKAKRENCKKLRWQVSEWNKPAINFYKGLGATVDGVEQNCDLILN
jgi:GNAT superfamily N-acetyltransferase